MSYRFMRIVVMFDLPMVTAAERRAYSAFRRNLLKMGYLMLQESIYCKIAPNGVMAESMVDALKKIKPPNGVVQVLRVTEKQYNKMDYIVGEKCSEVIDSDERLVII